MIKTDNLYAEVVINESPFFYDENGRLRVHTLNEQPQVVSEEQPLEEMSVRGPEQAPQSVTIMPSAPAAQAPVTSTASNGAPPKPPMKPGLAGLKLKPGIGRAIPSLPSKRDMRIDMGPGKKAPTPPGGNFDRMPKIGMGPVRRTDVQIPDQKMPTTDQGMDEIGSSRQQKPGMAPKKSFRDFRMSKGAMKGPGRNVNVRPTRPVSKGMMEDSRPATDYIEEKIDLKASEMGDVIKDFQKSDAPQFKGKSPEKRRIMAIAAKLQADRGTK